MPKRRDEVATASPAIMRVNPVLAKEIGLNESIVLLQLEYLVSISTSEERDGKQWTYQQWKGGFDQMFPWMAEKTLRRAIDSLKEKGLVETSRHRSYWYTVNRDEIAKITGQNVFLDEAESGQNVSSDDNETRQNVQLEQDKMSSHNKTNCPLPIPNEISTKRSSKKDDDADAIAPTPIASEPIRLNAEQRRDLATYDLVARYFELFACPTFLNAKGRIAGDIGKVAGKYKPEQLLKYLDAVGRQHPNAKARKEFLTSRPETLGPAVAAYLAAGCPDELPARIELSSTGASNDRRNSGLQPVGDSAQGTNKYREARILEDAIAERSRSQRRPVSA